MPDSVDGLLLLILTMPGFFGYLWFNRLYEGCVDDVFEKIGIVVGLNVAAIGVSQYFSDVVPSDLVDGQRNISVAATFGFVAESLVILSGIAILIGAACAWLCNAPWISQALVRLRLTRKSNSKSVLADIVRSHPNSYFKFKLKTGGYVVGHPRCYSLSGDENMIFLEKAAVRGPRVQQGGAGPKEREIAGDGILFLNFEDVSYVELV